MTEGLAEKGTAINCHECKYGSECNTANAHGYKVGFCSQYIQKTKAQTNADKIRSMTDEELAEWINEWFDCGNCAEFFGNMPCSRDKDCIKVWLAWLKEEVIK